jgi:DNA invertase Pin-like site-specific DNA recombinase
MSTLERFISFAPKGNDKQAKGQNAVIYTRVSHVSQEDNTSLESQKSECERYAIRKGYNVVAYFGGTYESAKTDDRKEFNKMIQYVKKSRNVAYIIVYSYERFSRSGISGAKIVQDLMMEHGIMTLAASQDLDPTTAAGQLQQNMLFIFGKMDNDMRRDKTTTGMREVIRKGYFPFNPPIGYTNLNKGRAVDQTIVVNTEGALLRKAFLWKANENMENATIVRKLNDLGLKTNEKTLGHVFSNPFYCGIIVSRLLPGEIIEGNHEAMISKELFLKVNNIVEENRHHPVSHNEDDQNLPLKRFMRCGKCDTPMTGYLVRKKGLYYYKCRVKGCGTNKSAKDAHEQFKTLISVFDINIDARELLGEWLKELFMVALEDQLENQRLLKAKMTEVNQRIEVVEERHAIGEIDRELFTKFIGKYTVERDKLQQELGS